MEFGVFPFFLSHHLRTFHTVTHGPKKYSNRHILIYIFVLIKSKNCLNDGAKKNELTPKDFDGKNTILAFSKFENCTSERYNGKSRILLGWVMLSMNLI